MMFTKLNHLVSFLKLTKNICCESDMKRTLFSSNIYFSFRIRSAKFYIILSRLYSAFRTQRTKTMYYFISLQYKEKSCPSYVIFFNSDKLHMLTKLNYLVRFLNLTTNICCEDGDKTSKTMSAFIFT